MFVVISGETVTVLLQHLWPIVAEKPWAPFSWQLTVSRCGSVVSKLLVMLFVGDIT